ncbi:hypothetical protein D3C84_1207710 [compost metagenome]
MVEEGHVTIGQFGVGQIQSGDVIKITLQGWHGAQMPSHWEIVKIEHRALQITV